MSLSISLSLLLCSAILARTRLAAGHAKWQDGSHTGELRGASEAIPLECALSILFFSLSLFSLTLYAYLSVFLSKLSRISLGLYVVEGAI